MTRLGQRLSWERDTGGNAICVEVGAGCALVCGMIARAWALGSGHWDLGYVGCALYYALEIQYAVRVGVRRAHAPQVAVSPALGLAFRLSLARLREV